LPGKFKAGKMIVEAQVLVDPSRPDREPKFELHTGDRGKN
jgi:hypothetical protein